MSTAFAKLVGHFQDRDLRYSTPDDHQTVVADFRGDVGTYRVIARVDDADGLFQVFAYMPLRIPEGARPAVAEAVVRANFGLKVGKFEFDMDDGEVLYQASQILAGEESGDSLSDGMIGRLIATSLAMLDKYVPALLSVVYANEPAREAIARAEHGEG